MCAEWCDQCEAEGRIVSRVHDFKGQPTCPACGFNGGRLSSTGDGVRLMQPETRWSLAAGAAAAALFSGAVNPLVGAAAGLVVMLVVAAILTALRADG